MIDSTLSVTEAVHLDSSLSVFDVLRSHTAGAQIGGKVTLSDGLSVLGNGVFGCGLSVMNGRTGLYGGLTQYKTDVQPKVLGSLTVSGEMPLGSSLSATPASFFLTGLSLSNAGYLGGKLSVTDAVQPLSSLTVAAEAKLGAAVRTYGAVQADGSIAASGGVFVPSGGLLSVANVVGLGVVSISASGFVGVSGDLSVTEHLDVILGVSIGDAFHLGNSFSVRSFARVGSILSADSHAWFGAKLSVEDDAVIKGSLFVHLRNGSPCRLCR